MNNFIIEHTRNNKKILRDRLSFYSYIIPDRRQSQTRIRVLEACNFFIRMLEKNNHRRFIVIICLVRSHSSFTMMILDQIKGAFEGCNNIVAVLAIVGSFIVASTGLQVRFPVERSTSSHTYYYFENRLLNYTNNLYF